MVHNVKTLFFYCFFLTSISVAYSEQYQGSAQATDSELQSSYLASYKASGVTFALDEHYALIASRLNPQFTVTYRNKKGAVKHRTYQADIKLTGLNFELALRPSFITFIGNVNFLNSDVTIELGKGIEVSLPTMVTMLPKALNPGIDWIDLSMAPVINKAHASENYILRIDSPLPGTKTIYQKALSQVRLGGLTVTLCPCKNVPGRCSYSRCH